MTTVAAAPKPLEPLRPLNALGVLVLCAAFGAAGLGLTWLGSQSFVNSMRLSATGVTAEAYVTDARVMESRRTGLSYEVRYQFTAPGNATVYTATDETGRTDLWEELADEATWRTATSTQHVTVEYLPGDPAVNRPLAGTTASFGEDQLAGLCLGLALFIPCTLIFFGTTWGQMVRLRRRLA
jgi:hypothetical protein